jgi:hypothetical protein
MRRIFVLAWIVALAVALIAPATAAAVEGFPYGKWTGSAVGDSGANPVAVTVWLSDNGDGTVGITVSTPAVPFAFDANPGTPIPVNGGFDLPITVAYGSGDNAISGSGTIRLRKRTNGWYAWGSGSGSALGNSGGGRGSANLVSEKVSIVDQFISPFADTFGPGSGDGPTPMPEEYPAGEFNDAPPAPPEAEADTNWLQAIIDEMDVPPNEVGEVVALTIMLLFLLLLDVFPYGFAD